MLFVHEFLVKKVIPIAIFFYQWIASRSEDFMAPRAARYCDQYKTVYLSIV